MRVSTMVTVLLALCGTGATVNGAMETGRIRNEKVAQRVRVFGETISSEDHRQKRAVWSPFQKAWRAIVKSTVFGSKIHDNKEWRYKTYVKVGTLEDAFADFKSLVPKIIPNPYDPGYHGFVGNSIKISIKKEDTRNTGYSTARLVLREIADEKVEITVDYVTKEGVNDVVEMYKHWAD